MTLRIRQTVALLLLALGVECWLMLSGLDTGRPIQHWILGVMLAAWLVPPVRRGLFAALSKIRRPSRRTAVWTAIGVALAAALFLYWTAAFQGRTLAPVWHDQFCYLIQARILGGGRLWMPHHPLGEFFESFYLLTDRVYSPMYFPGTALMLVPFVKVGLPAWAMTLAAAAGAAGLLYWIVTEILDGVAGIMAVMLLLGTSVYRQSAMDGMAQMPTMLLGELVVWGYLKWLGSRPLTLTLSPEYQGEGKRWEILAGGLSGWLAITRPLDAICLATPVIVMMVWGKFPRKGIGPMLGRLAGGAAPFLAMQLVFNLGVTGSAWQTPFEYYSQRDQPGMKLGFNHVDPAAKVASNLAEKKALYEREERNVIAWHAPSRWREIVQDRFTAAARWTIPSVWLLLALPLSLLAMDRRRAVIWMALPLFAAAYVFYPNFPRYYCTPVVPAGALAVVMAAAALERTFARFRQAIGTFCFMAVAALCLAALPQMDRSIVDGMAARPVLLPRVDEALSKISGPAIVLFRFDPRDNKRSLYEEPVYNADVAWPDNARIIRAHDLGDNQRLFDYYAKRQPEREVYIFDEATYRLADLGVVSKLVQGAR